MQQAGMGGQVMEWLHSVEIPPAKFLSTVCKFQYLLVGQVSLPELTGVRATGAMNDHGPFDLTHSNK